MKCPKCYGLGFKPCGWSASKVSIELCPKCHPDPQKAVENAKERYPKSIAIDCVGWGWPKAAEVAGKADA